MTTMLTLEASEAMARGLCLNSGKCATCREGETCPTNCPFRKSPAKMRRLSSFWFCEGMSRTLMVTYEVASPSAVPTS